MHVPFTQGYLTSKPTYLITVPATQNLARELTSGLACPLAPLGIISRSSTHKLLDPDKKDPKSDEVRAAWVEIVPPMHLRGCGANEGRPFV
jgi:hypothetical protein